MNFSMDFLNGFLKFEWLFPFWFHIDLTCSFHGVTMDFFISSLKTSLFVFTLSTETLLSQTATAGHNLC